LAIESTVAAQSLMRLIFFFPAFAILISIMLVEKIRDYGFSNAVANKSSNKFENYLGPRILPWFANQINQVAVVHDIVDRDRKTLALTTVDLLRSNPNCSESSVAAYLDKKSARQVISQIALLVRLRSILLNCKEDNLRAMVGRAIRSSNKVEDEWEKKPSWWDDSSTDHSFLLLTKLDKYGFLEIMSEETAREGFGDASEVCCRSQCCSKISLEPHFFHTNV
jgi:hypothetical protein